MISKDEISRYDRQIRLWGLDGQQRLSSSRVLVVGIKAVAVELLKNIVLAGVGSVCLLDDSKIESEDLAFNFFARADEVGMNRAHVTLRRLQQLNTRVALTSDDRALEDVPDSFFEEFNVVICTETPYEQLVRINRHCHQRDIGFYASGLLGWAGYIFADLVKHEFRVDKEDSGFKPEIGSVSGTREIISVTESDKGLILKVSETYTSLADAVHNAKTTPFGSSLRKKQKLKVSPYLPGLLAYWESSSLSTTEVESVAHAVGLPNTILANDWPHKFIQELGAELGPIAAVIGGFLAQDTINFITRKDDPIQNLMIYDAFNGKGAIYTL